MPGPLAALIRAKHPGAYDDMDDASLEKAVLAKYPEYHDLAEPKGDTYAGPDTYDAGFYKSLKEQGKALAKTGLDTLPGVGAIVGGALSTPETFGAGTVPGIALGAGVGRAARDLIGHATGLDAPSTPLEKAGSIAGETAVTGLVAGALPGVIEGVRTPVQTLREGAEQFKSVLPRWVGKILPSIPETAPGPIMQRPAWQGWPQQAPVDLSRPVPAGSLTQEGIAERIAAVKANGGLPAQTVEQMPSVRGTLRMAPAEPVAAAEEPVALPESWKPFADAKAPAQRHLVDPQRIDIGAEKVGRAHGMTKQEVRNIATPVVGEAQGEASPILPEEPLKRIIDTLKGLPKDGPEREAYVARATSGKARGQVENIRRTLEHLGLIVPVAAVGGAALKDAILGRMRGATTSSAGAFQTEQ